MFVLFLYDSDTKPLLVSKESDTFDLAGQNVTTISNNVAKAFREPLPIQDMIRITFVTGAGKLGRQKYDEGAAKAVTSALKELGFEEDRGASCVMECAGSYKLQHDTGKNLKTVVVFPNVESSDEGEATAAGNTFSGGDSGGVEPVLPQGSPEEMIAMSSKGVFENMVKSRCPSWSQKKGCMTALSSIKALLEGLDEKLLTGTPLKESEQSFYDSVSVSVIDEKQAHVKDLMHNQVDNGIITTQEKKMLIGQVAEKLQTLSKEITTAEEEGKLKRAQKLNETKEKLETRRTKLERIEPKGPHRLKHEDEIAKLRTEMQPLLDLVVGAKGRLLSVKETQSLARKDEILEEISELEVGRS